MLPFLQPPHLSSAKRGVKHYSACMVNTLEREAGIVAGPTGVGIAASPASGFGAERGADVAAWPTAGYRQCTICHKPG